MTNSVVQAFDKAGIKVSMKRRLWAYVKDHPRRTVKELAAVMGIKVDNIGVELRGMQLRGMLEVDKEKRLIDGRGGSKLHRNITIYSVPPHMREYELLPLVKKGAPVPRKTAKVQPQEQPALDIGPYPRPVFNASIFVQDLTLKEAKQVYEYLGRMFK